MAYLNDLVLDNGLSYVNANGSRLDICSQEPANYTEATSTYTLGNKTSLTAGAPENGDSSGRKSVIPAITDGSVTGTGTASHWGYSKTSATAALLAATSLSSSQAVTSGNTFTLGAIDITIPDPS
tara:strand:- start:80 stop:454 length:375 start_codon:yes stop_codon:yes gene_type:complete